MITTIQTANCSAPLPKHLTSAAIGGMNGWRKKKRYNNNLKVTFMKTTEVNKKIIGRRCKCIFTGLLVTGIIEAVEENEHSVQVKVRFDTPHQWGG